MPLPESFLGRIDPPMIAAPQFLVSGTDYVIEACKAGIVGSFPALNQRNTEAFEQWVVEIKKTLADHAASGGRAPAPYGVNLIVHDSNPRVEADLEICIKHEVPLIITSLGAVSELVDRVHDYGGLVFHDVINMRHARSAARAGVDGLILVCAGAGGHAGVINPFALVPEARAMFEGTIILAGAISDGRSVAAAIMMGADLAYLGTRFIATTERMASDENKQMILDSYASDIVYTPKISGVPGSFLRQSLIHAGFDPDKLPDKDEVNVGEELNSEARAWKNIWSAGQGVGAIHDVPSTAELVARFKDEYHAAIAELAGRAGAQAAE